MLDRFSTLLFRSVNKTLFTEIKPNTDSLRQLYNLQESSKS